MSEQLVLDEAGSRRCGGRFDWNGRPLRCEQQSRHAGWHTSRPRRGALVRWNDAGSFETSEPTGSRKAA